MQTFIPGLKLSELFYNEAVKPILDRQFPDLVYSTALIGSGSEVLGFDTLQSMDHHWGPKLMLFVSEEDEHNYAEKIKEVLSNKLPYEIHGISTHFSKPYENGVQLLEKIDSGTVNHLISVSSIKPYFEKALGHNPYKLTIIDWLTTSEQKLLEVTAGKVFHDGLGELNKLREKLAYYPNDVWLYILACQWIRISQEEAFVGRCGDIGDELGSQIVAARLVRELMRLSFLMEKKYAPYAKWLGTAFSKLSITQKLSPILRDVLLTKDWKERESNLGKAYGIVATKHNELGITKPMPTTTSSFYDRPYLVIHGDVFAKAIKTEIRDETVKNIKGDIGSVDQFIDSTDVLSRSLLTQKLNILFE